MASSPRSSTGRVRQANRPDFRLPNTPPDTPPCAALSRDSSSDCVDSLALSSDFKKEVDSNPVVAVIGTGYVGLHLVEAFSVAYKVIAFDVSEQRLKDVEDRLPPTVTCTSNASSLTQATHFLVSVSTVIDEQQNIDTSSICEAIQTIEKYARPGSTVVIESSVAVGMTRELLAPLMRSNSLKCGMSPERVDPGRTSPPYTSIPKIISGLDQQSLQSIRALYSPIFHSLVPVSSTEVAEMTKLYENCQRMMCIAYANEMADACAQLSRTLSAKPMSSLGEHKISIDPFEVSRAAATKPFGYMPYSPSLGVGGHCIPCNPFYLLSNAEFPLLEACTTRMRNRPARIGDRLMAKLESSTSGPQILVVGLGFKRGQSVLSNSPGLALMKHLLSKYTTFVEYSDPLVEQSAVSWAPKLDESDWTIEILQRFDAIVVAVAQPGLDLDVVREVQLRGTHVEWFCIA